MLLTSNSFTRKTDPNAGAPGGVYVIFFEENKRSENLLVIKRADPIWIRFIYYATYNTIN